tara:strand:- start:457 stop:1122 length:666 start_codon:yes stop_codon:yes gene_type:complete
MYSFGLACALLVISKAATQEKVNLSGTIETPACAQACGICCPTHSVVDTSGTLSLQIGNTFVDLSEVSDDGQLHELSGYFYETTGQCGIGECTLFAVEQLDQQQIAAPIYDAVNEKLSIETVVVDTVDQGGFSVTLAAPFNVSSAIEISEQNIIPQGDDCSAESAICADGTVCLAYFGIAGPQGPEFKTCEIPCSHPGASCPLDQSCVTIADGPGQVCIVD